jgi:membrane-bound lytic murein transglycosylase B
VRAVMISRKLFIFAGFAVCVLFLAGPMSGQPGEYLSNPGGDPSTWKIADTTVFLHGEPANTYVRQLLNGLAAEEGAGLRMSEEEFRQLLQRASPVVYVDKVLKYANPQSVQLQHHDHEEMVKTYLQEKWLRAGEDFIRVNGKALKGANKKYKVAVNDLVSILLWESQLGKSAGELLVFNVLLGQILYLDQARDWAVREILTPEEREAITAESAAREKQRLNRLRRSAVRNLIALIRVAREMEMEVTSLKGSWGGAMGYVQFMPSSMQFAVDGNNDGAIDLCVWPDAIYSAANFLSLNGYRETAKGRRRAVHAYNPLDSYVSGVIQYADSLGRYLRRPPARPLE